MRTYFVSWEEPCERCSGSGVVQDSEWSIYWEETNGHRDLPLDEQAIADDVWWAERGYYGVRNWPPEETDCPECGGMMVRHGRISLADALSAIAKTTATP